MVHHIYLFHLPRDLIHEKTHGPSIVDLISQFLMYQVLRMGMLMLCLGWIKIFFGLSGSRWDTFGVGNITSWIQDMYKLHDSRNFSGGLVQDITHYTVCFCITGISLSLEFTGPKPVPAWKCWHAQSNTCSICQDGRVRTRVSYTESWLKPYRTPLGWTRMQTVHQAFLPDNNNVRSDNNVRPHKSSNGWIGRNSQLLKDMSL